MNISKSVFLLLIGICLRIGIMAQSSSLQVRPSVGDAFPEFDLKDVHYLAQKHVRLEDFKGKWLVLDFWNEYCTACINSFPKTNKLNKKFSDKVQFLLVGYTGSNYSVERKSSNEGIRLLFEKLRKRMDLDISVAYDSTLFDRFRITGCPFIFIINPEGRVAGITNELTETNISDFLAGRHPSLATYSSFALYNEGNDPYDMNKDYSLSVATKRVLYRSFLSSWDRSMPDFLAQNVIPLDSASRKFEIFKASLANLYMLAYLGQIRLYNNDSLYGEFFPQPVFDIKDSSMLRQDAATGIGYYCYSLTVPPFQGTKQKMMQTMQNDLKNYFGYDATIEDRKMPYWELISTPVAREKLITKADTPSYDDFHNLGFSIKKTTMQYVITRLWIVHQDLVFIDGTGIRSNIDITIRALLTDWTDFKLALQKNGLELVRKEKSMKVVVIKDSKKISDPLKDGLQGCR